MKNYFKLQCGPGENFHTVAKKAKNISEMETFKGDGVEFEFNEIRCVVNKYTNLDLLWRDYANAHIMEWTTIGPNCKEQYNPHVQQEFERRTQERRIKEEERQAVQDAKDKKEQNEFNQKTKGIYIALKDQKSWDEWKAKNTDPYGDCIFRYAESWARLMQAEITSGKNLIDIAQKTSYELGFMGITGFMYGAAVSILSNCWIYGEELSQWHNNKYGYKGKGVVNPAVLTIR